MEKKFCPYCSRVHNKNFVCIEQQNSLKDEIQNLREIEAEISACFNGWDGAIKNKQQPVPIQDLDDWSFRLFNIIKRLEKREAD